MSKQYKKLISLLATGTLASVCSPTWASGFALLEAAAADMGTAYAGTAARAEDASTGYWNPAGLTRLGDEQAVASAIVIIPQAKLKATRATPTLSLPGSVANIAPGTAKSRAVGVVPGLHYAKHISDCVVFGLNITSPFGLKTKYRHDSVARYMSTRSEIRTYDVSPCLAFGFANGISFGFGVDFIYNFARIDSLLGTGNTTNLGNGLGNGDGRLENTVSRWAVAGHAGVLLEFTECTRLGINYRSGYKVRGKGTANFDPGASIALLSQRATRTPGPGPGPVGPIAGDLTRLGVRANLRMPSTATVSFYSDLTECWAILADAQWTEWKKFKEITGRYDNGFVLTQKFNFRDTVRYALGTAYAFDECWLGRLGVAWDRSPVRQQDRTTNIPDSDRTWAAAGIRYRFTPCLAMDLSYAHVFFRNSKIMQGPPNLQNAPFRLQESITGRYKSHADLIGIQLTWDIA